MLHFDKALCRIAKNWLHAFNVNWQITCQLNNLANREKLYFYINIFHSAPTGPLGWISWCNDWRWWYGRRNYGCFIHTPIIKLIDGNTCVMALVILSKYIRFISDRRSATNVVSNHLLKIWIIRFRRVLLLIMRFLPKTNGCSIHVISTNCNARWSHWWKFMSLKII